MEYITLDNSKIKLRVIFECNGRWIKDIFKIWAESHKSINDYIKDRYVYIEDSEYIDNILKNINNERIIVIKGVRYIRKNDTIFVSDYSYEKYE